LGHRGPGLHAAGQGVAVVAVGGDDVVILAEDADRTDGDRFLSTVEVAEPADGPLLVEHRRAFFEPSDQEHLAQPAQGLVAGDDRLGLGLCLRHVVRLLNWPSLGRPAVLAVRSGVTGPAGVDPEITAGALQRRADGPRRGPSSADGSDETIEFTENATQ